VHRSTVPLLLLVLLVGAVFLYFRPVQLRDLVALAEKLDLPVGYDGGTESAAERNLDPYMPGTPRRPTATARPASWPGTPVQAAAGRSDRAFVPREDETEPPSAQQYEYPDTGLPAHEVGRPQGTPYDAWSDPFGDHASGAAPAQSGPAPPGRAWDDPGRRPPATRPQDGRPIGPPPPRGAAPPSANAGVPCEGAEILARVGNDVILARDVFVGIAELREKNKDRVPPDVLEANIREILRKAVEMRIEEKLLYLRAQSTYPKDRWSKIQAFYGDAFEKHKVPEMMQKMNLGSRQELEQEMRKAGTSLEMQKQRFLEAVIAQAWLKSEVKTDEDIGYDQFVTYYREHPHEFVEHPPMARWEQLTVRPSRFPSRQAAYAALAEMGNLVLDGAPWSEVARARSQGLTAEQGGFRDWTGKGNLNSKTLDEAIFTLPIGRPSEILEDEQGFHIVRVIERRNLVRKPFSDAQVDIKKKVLAKRQDDAEAAYTAKLREQMPVWTAFDNDRDAKSARIDALLR
jgi:hypothetical protein